MPEDEQKKFGGDSVRGTPYSSPQGTPTKSFSPIPQDFQEERMKLNGLLEEKVMSITVGGAIIEGVHSLAIGNVNQTERKYFAASAFFKKYGRPASLLSYQHIFAPALNYT